MTVQPKVTYVTRPLITLPKHFVGPVPGNTLFKEVASLGGDEFRWFIRKGKDDEVTEFHRQARALAFGPEPGVTQ